MSRKVITDMGGPVTATETLKGADNETLRETSRNIGRYGVWQDGNVIATGDDLETLQREHGPGLAVVPIRGSGPSRAQ